VEYPKAIGEVDQPFLYHERSMSNSPDAGCVFLFWQIKNRALQENLWVKHSPVPAEILPKAG
jgi:hypothetical protein